MKAISVSLLICFLITCAAATTSSIQLDVFSGSNAYWLAFAVRNAGVDTRSVQMKEAQSSSWVSMDYSSGWGYYTYNTRRDKLSFPVSVRLTSANGQQVTIDNAISSVSAGVVNTGVSYGSSSAPSATSAPTKAATTRPAATTKPSATTKPTKAATTKPAATSRPAATTKPTKAATTAPTSRPAATTRPATTAPTVRPAATTRPATTAPTTRPAATTRPATTAPTTRPATVAPTKASSGGCSGPMKLMVPLYQYPGAAWDVVVNNGRTVPTVAIINPSSGPGNGGPDSAFTNYMNKLHNAGVEMVGYVHTQWGARSISTVKKEIDQYASLFPLLSGIFLDEGGATDAVLPYYRELHSYIMSMPGWKYNIINPGTTPTSGYLNAATQIVSFEDTSSKFAASSNPSYASCSNKDKFAVITYGASSSGMQSAVNTARSKGYYGWVYITDGAGGCCTYNKIASYYASMASYIASGN